MPRVGHRQGLFFLWLLLSALLVWFLNFSGDRYMRSAVEKTLVQHFLLTLDEAYFSSADNRLNDQFALQRVGHNINIALEGFFENSWYAPQRDCSARLLEIDGVVIEEGEGQGLLNLTIPRNQIDRELKLGLDCATNAWPAAGLVALLALGFTFISALLPPPLSRRHRNWINYLSGRGYSGEEAFALLSQFDESGLDLNETQSTCLEQLHEDEEHNFAWAMQVVLDPRVAALPEQDAEWLLLGLRRNPENLDAAVALAAASDALTIDLATMTLEVRGLQVEMSGTPLFYYAWYALARAEGEGWIVNPASNRPDLAAGQALASLMECHGGHARAINDLESAGLKAKTLDQNRSRIKDELSAALGEKLATNYLFEAGRLSDGVNMQYRIKLPTAQISVLGQDLFPR